MRDSGIGNGFKVSASVTTSLDAYKSIIKIFQEKRDECLNGRVTSSLARFRPPSMAIVCAWGRWGLLIKTQIT